VINDLDDLRHLLERYEEFDLESVVRLGRISALLAAKGLLRAGTRPSRSNILRTLDAYDFVLADESRHRALSQGLEEAIEMIRADPKHFESALWRQLG
jgi:hypothetical protein